MANSSKPAYQGKALSPAPNTVIKLSQGRETAAVSANVRHPLNEPPMPADPISPRHPNEITNPTQG
jgi:hypothetical protein